MFTDPLMSTRTYLCTLYLYVSNYYRITKFTHTYIHYLHIYIDNENGKKNTHLNYNYVEYCDPKNQSNKSKFRIY